MGIQTFGKCSRKAIKTPFLQPDRTKRRQVDPYENNKIIIFRHKVHKSETVEKHNPVLAKESVMVWAIATAPTDRSVSSSTK